MLNFMAIVYIKVPLPPVAMVVVRSYAMIQLYSVDVVVAVVVVILLFVFPLIDCVWVSL